MPLARNTGATAPDAGWALVGNPYPSPLNCNLIAPADRQNLDASMYVYESSAQYSGTYRAFVNGVGSGNPLIGSGQGFFVRVTAVQTLGSLTFHNAQRVTSYASQVPFRRGTAETRPLVQLRLQGPAGPSDALYVYAENGATAGFDPNFDATKLPNPSGLNLSAAASTGEQLAISALAQLGAATALPLSLGVPAPGTYTLRAEQLLNLPATLSAYLFDAQTGQTINLSQQAEYTFTVTTAQVAKAQANRFELRFGTVSGPLASASAQLAAEVALYPNPAQGQFTVTLPRQTGAAAIRAKLFNSLGQRVRADIALSTTGAPTTVNVADLAKGVYSLRLQIGTTSVVKRVTVQ